MIFDVYDLDVEQKTALTAIVNFIVNVYVPIFVQINLHPHVPDGPGIVLLSRDLMMKHGVPDRVKNIFLDHAVTWMSPVNVAVEVHKKDPSILLQDVKNIRKLAVDTRKLCWSKKPIKHFFTVESACAPCISHGSTEFWQNVENHNRTSERYIGKMGDVFKNGWVKDNQDDKLDNRVRGYVLNMGDLVESELNE